MRLTVYKSIRTQFLLGIFTIFVNNNNSNTCKYQVGNTFSSAQLTSLNSTRFSSRKLSLSFWKLLWMCTELAKPRQRYNLCVDSGATTSHVAYRIRPIIGFEACFLWEIVEMNINTEDLAAYTQMKRLKIYRINSYIISLEVNTFPANSNYVLHWDIFIFLIYL